MINLPPVDTFSQQQFYTDNSMKGKYTHNDGDNPSFRSQDKYSVSYPEDTIVMDLTTSLMETWKNHKYQKSSDAFSESL
jgi:hypothetical protein